MDTVISPCISVCKMDPESDLCEGCWRTRDEIRSWKNATDPERRELIKVLHQRREQAGQGCRRRG